MNWGELSGMTWRHMELFPQLDEEQPKAPDGIGEFPSHAISNGNGNSHSVPVSGLSTPNQRLGVDNDRSHNNGLLSASREADASSRVISRPIGRRKRTKGIDRLPSVPKAHGRRKSLQVDSFGAYARRGWRNRAGQSLLLQNPAFESRVVAQPDVVKHPTQQGKTARCSDRGAVTRIHPLSISTPSPKDKFGGIHGQRLGKRSQRRRNRSPNPKDNGSEPRSKHVTFESSTRAPPDPGRPNRSPPGSQPPVAASMPRRSARIAELQKAGSESERSPKAEGSLKRKRNAATSSTDNAKERLKSKRRNTFLLGRQSSDKE